MKQQIFHSKYKRSHKWLSIVKIDSDNHIPTRFTADTQSTFDLIVTTFDDVSNSIIETMEISYHLLVFFVKNLSSIRKPPLLQKCTRVSQRLLFMSVTIPCNPLLGGTIFMKWVTLE